jgi:hypothetical protein
MGVLVLTILFQLNRVAGAGEPIWDGLEGWTNPLNSMIPLIADWMKERLIHRDNCYDFR